MDVKKELNDVKNMKVDFQFKFDRAYWLNLHSALEKLPLETLKSHAQPD